MLYALLECVFTLSSLCGLFVCTVLFGRDVCLSGLCMFNVKCDMLYWSGVFNLSSLCGLFVCTVLFGRDCLFVCTVYV